MPLALLFFHIPFYRPKLEDFVLLLPLQTLVRQVADLVSHRGSPYGVKGHHSLISLEVSAGSLAHRIKGDVQIVLGIEEKAELLQTHLLVSMKLR